MKTKVILLFFLTIILLSSCSNQKEVSSLVQPNSEQFVKDSSSSDVSSSISGIGRTSFPEKFEKTEQNIVFKTTIVADHQHEFVQASCVPLTIDQEKVKDKMVQDEYILDPQIVVEEEDVIVYSGLNESELVLSSNYVSYVKSYEKNSVSAAFPHCLVLEKRNPQYNADLYPEKEFEFLSIQEAYNQVEKLLDELGISSRDLSYNVYSLDYKTLEAEEEIINLDGEYDFDHYKSEWTEKDNSYYFAVFQQYNGINLYRKYHESVFSLDDTITPMSFLYNEDGLQRLNLSDLLEIKTSKSVELVPFEAISQTIIHKYTNILTESTFEVRTAELIYITEKQPDDSYKMYPAWYILINECSNENEDVGDFSVLINAITGKEEVLT